MHRQSGLRGAEHRLGIKSVIFALGFALLCPLGYAAPLEAEPVPCSEKEGENWPAKPFEFVAETARRCCRVPTSDRAQYSARLRDTSSSHGRLPPTGIPAAQRFRNGFGGPLRL